MDILLKYYGIDWAATITAMLTIYLLGRKMRSGFLIGVLSSLLWLIFNGMVASVAGVLANIILVFINLQGYWKWARERDKAKVK